MEPFPRGGGADLSGLYRRDDDTRGYSRGGDDQPLRGQQWSQQDQGGGGGFGGCSSSVSYQRRDDGSQYRTWDEPRRYEALPYLQGVNRVRNNLGKEFANSKGKIGPVFFWLGRHISNGISVGTNLTSLFLSTVAYAFTRFTTNNFHAKCWDKMKGSLVQLSYSVLTLPVLYEVGLGAGAKPSFANKWHAAPKGEHFDYLGSDSDDDDDDRMYPLTSTTAAAVPVGRERQ